MRYGSAGTVKRCPSSQTSGVPFLLTTLNSTIPGDLVHRLVYPDNCRIYPPQTSSEPLRLTS
jgi:hypothetical protein